MNNNLMMDEKTTFVSDLLHGTIGLSPLEKRLISAEVFNRLHNILQNSSAYFTFPCNRTSRFSHSLGVTHIAGGLFRNGLLNAKESAKKSFLQHYIHAIAHIGKSESYRADVKRYIKLSSPGDLSGNNLSIGCPFYTSANLPSLSNEEANTYTLLFQALRFSALLHDLGHPPFSHVTEYALKTIWSKLIEASETSEQSPISKAKTDLLETFNSFLSNPDSDTFHEVFGRRFASTLMDQLLDGLREEGCSELILSEVIRIKHITNAILEGDKDFLAIHDIVSSSFDADRLDYVQRDLLMCGFSREPFRTERIIQSYTLIESDGSFSFYPSMRALNNIEDFYIQRFHLYKYAIYHHRVVKFDALLQRSIEDLAGMYLNDGNTANSAQQADGHSLRGDVSGMWQILSQDAQSYTALGRSYYIQWDDAWLLGMLRRKYFELRELKKHNNGKADSILEVRLDEILSNRKNYHTLYKRAECFADIDSSFVDSSDPDFDWGVLSGNALGNSSSVVTKALKELPEYVRSIKGLNGEVDMTGLVESNGYVLSTILKIVKLVDGKRASFPFLQDAGNRLQKMYEDREVADVIVVKKLITPGVTRHFEVVTTEHELIPLGRVSRVAEDLERAALLFPPFFIFVQMRKNSMELRSEMRKSFGNLLWITFTEWCSTRVIMYNGKEVVSSV